MAVVLTIGLLFILLLVGAPIAYALLLAGTLGLWLELGWDSLTPTVLSVLHAETASFTLSTVPMFILMAEFLSQSRLTGDIFTAIARWLGPVRGGLAASTVAANAVFGAMSGSSVAAAGLLGRVSVPQMRKYGYDERLSLGTVASAGTLAVLIPPSIALIVYGVATEVSIGRLFAAALIPGLLVAAGYAILVVAWVTISPSSAPPVERYTLREKLAATVPALPAIPLIALVLFALYSGVATPTEAGALGAAAALIIAVIFGGLRTRGFVAAVASTVAITAMIMIIIAGATIFSRFLSISGTAQSLVTTINESGLPSLSVLGLLLLLYLVLGFFVDQTAILLMTLPVTFPVIMQLGYDPIWFGIIATLTVEIGLVTPPLGLNVLVTHAAAGGQLSDIFKGALIFTVVPVIALIGLIAFPDAITTFGNIIYRE